MYRHDARYTSEEEHERENAVSPFSSSFREVTSPCRRNKEKHNGTFFRCVDSYDNTPTFFPGKDSAKNEKAPEVVEARRGRERNACENNILKRV